MYHANLNQKEVGMAILTSEKVAFRAKNIIRSFKRALHNDKGVKITRQKMSTGYRSLKKHYHPHDITDIYRALYIITTQYTLFSGDCGIFSKIIFWAIKKVSIKH